MHASKLHDQLPSSFAPKTFNPKSGSVNQKMLTEVQNLVQDFETGLTRMRSLRSQWWTLWSLFGLYGGLSTASITTTISVASGETGLLGSVSSGSEKNDLLQVKKEVTKTQSIASLNASSGGFNVGTPKENAQAEIPKPSLCGSSAPPSGDGDEILGEKPEAKLVTPEKKTSIFGKLSGGSTGGIFGSTAPSGGSIFGSALSKPPGNPFAPKANPFGSKSSGVNPFSSASIGSDGPGDFFGSTTTKTLVKEYKFNEENSEDEHDETEDEDISDYDSDYHSHYEEDSAEYGNGETEDEILEMVYALGISDYDSDYGGYSAEHQSADETLIPNRQSEEPPMETKVGFKVYPRISKMIFCMNRNH